VVSLVHLYTQGYIINNTTHSGYICDKFPQCKYVHSTSKLLTELTNNYSPQSFWKQLHTMNSVAQNIPNVA